MQNIIENYLDQVELAIFPPTTNSILTAEQGFAFHEKGTSMGFLICKDCVQFQQKDCKICAFLYPRYFMADILEHYFILMLKYMKAYFEDKLYISRGPAQNMSFVTATT